MTFASLRNTSAFIVALTGAALLGGTAPASGASITYSDPACASFTVTGSNGNLTLVCSGGGGGTPTGAPTGCSIAASPSSLPAGGGSVDLSVSCSGGDPVTGYQWTASPSAAGFPATGASPSASITATTAFTVVASNGNGTGQATRSVQVGGVAGGISCAAQGFAKTLSYTWNWANAGGLTVQTSSDAQGPIGQNGIIVVAFTPMVSVLGSIGSVSIAPFGTGAFSGTTRTTTISTTPCAMDGAFPWQHVGTDAGTQFTVGNYNTRLYPGLVAGTTYYINIASRNAAGSSTCGNSGSTCDVRVQFTKPQQ